MHDHEGKECMMNTYTVVISKTKVILADLLIFDTLYFDKNSIHT